MINHQLIDMEGCFRRQVQHYRLANTVCEIMSTKLIERMVGTDVVNSSLVHP